jgi:GNAT superfamily N-acetyltransferase
VAGPSFRGQFNGGKAKYKNNVFDGACVIENRDAVGEIGRAAVGRASTRIRLATVDDLAAIVRCLELAFAPFNEFEDSQYPQLSDDLKSQIFEGSIRLIFDETQVLGFISFWPAADQMFIDTLAVLPTHHGQGLGSKLLAFADIETLRLGFKAVTLFTKARMTGNLQFYQRRGYRETGRCNDDGFCRVFYTKTFPPMPEPTVYARSVS